jgi:hypothetical protein
LDEERSSPSRRNSALAWAAALLAVPCLFVLWWLLRDEPAPEVAGPGLPLVEIPAAPAAPVPIPPEPPTMAATSDSEPTALRYADSEGPHEPGTLPHPITPQHERIFRENNLIGNLNGAMDVKDVQGLRKLLAQYREEYPEDAHVMQDGYELIANCLENPGPETRSVAQRYYDEQLDSGLRRYIRRHCLEAPQ